MHVGTDQQGTQVYLQLAQNSKVYIGLVAVGTGIARCTQVHRFSCSWQGIARCTQVWLQLAQNSKVYIGTQVQLQLAQNSKLFTGLVAVGTEQQDVHLSSISWQEIAGAYRSSCSWYRIARYTWIQLQLSQNSKVYICLVAIGTELQGVYGSSCSWHRIARCTQVQLQLAQNCKVYMSLVAVGTAQQGVHRSSCSWHGTASCLRVQFQLTLINKIYMILFLLTRVSKVYIDLV